MSEDARFIRSLRLRNLLSFGPDSDPIELGSLNVLIGPNGSGKSNVIEAIDLLRATASDLVDPVRAGGGTAEWLWKGVDEPPHAELEATLTYPKGIMPLRHRISFTVVGQRFGLVDEAVENERRRWPQDGDVQFYYRFREGDPSLRVSRTRDSKDQDDGGGRYRQPRLKGLTENESVLSQRLDPSRYPEITHLSDQYRQIKLFRNWELGRSSNLRRPQPVDSPNDFLAEDASNLGLVLNQLERTGNISDSLDVHFAKFYEHYKDFTVSIEGGTVQVFLREKDLNGWIPASRLSNGTLRFLCLASILCHPTPPPLICIEEPELGLHPDILPAIADMLIEASQRTQIIATTHSDILVAALTHIPEAVLVCEKESNATSVRRLDPDRLHEWLKDYSLGDLWLSGELGGNRW